MKKKLLLRLWERAQTNYYNYLDDDELLRDYQEWFACKDTSKDISRDEIISKLILSELEWRKDESEMDLYDTIQDIKKLSVI